MSPRRKTKPASSPKKREGAPKPRKPQARKSTDARHCAASSDSAAVDFITARQEEEDARMIMPLLKRDAMDLDPKIEAARIEIETAELEQWACMFDFGHDYFNHLPRSTDTSPHVWIRETRQAWDRLGNRFLAERKPSDRQPWALKRFGKPGDKSTKAPSSHRHKKW